jgi:hypothetical protein
MSEKETNRVLVRTGARLLSREECEHVAGGFQTNVCTINRQTCNADGDSCHVQPGCLPA